MNIESNGTQIITPYIPNIDEIESSHANNNYIHVRIRQRTNRTKITSIEGLPSDLDHKKLCRFMQKEFNCGGGKVTQTEEFGSVIQLAGDQRDNVVDFLLKEEIVEKKNQIKIHGY